MSITRRLVGHPSNTTDINRHYSKTGGILCLILLSLSVSKVLVGHTLHRDLSAMRMDALLILDISLLSLGKKHVSHMHCSLLSCKTTNGIGQRQPAPKERERDARYGIHGQPKRRPALAHLVKQVLRRDDFRAANSTEVHDCVQDVLMTMEVVTCHDAASASGGNDTMNAALEMFIRGRVTNAMDF